MCDDAGIIIYYFILHSCAINLQSVLNRQQKSSQSGKSFINNINSKGPMTDPWGIPDKISLNKEN